MISSSVSCGVYRRAANFVTTTTNICLHSPQQQQQQQQQYRCISKSSVAFFAHPEDRLKAARRQGLAKLGLPVDGNSDASSADAFLGVGQPKKRHVIENSRPPPAAPSKSTTSPHPEDRLKAARRKALQRLGISVDGSGEVVKREESSHTSNVTFLDAAAKPQPQSTMSICAQNNHPDYRLRVAREKMLAKVKMQIGGEDQTDSSRSSSSFEGKQSTSVLRASRSEVQISVLSPDRRLSLARTEQASKPVQTFVPIKQRKKKRPEEMSVRLSSEQPPPPRNDGYSSGAIVSLRLSVARKEAIDRLVAASSASNSADVGI